MFQRGSPSILAQCMVVFAVGLLSVAEASADDSAEHLESNKKGTLISSIASQVRSNDLFQLMRCLTGEEAILSEGERKFINTRHTVSGAPLRRALNFARDHFSASGLTPEFRGWSRDGYTNRNLIATQRGTTRSNEFVLFIAHLDVRPLEKDSPGADDNASGCAAVLTAARLLNQHRFERSIRYILFTGEEQGGLGSSVEAERSLASREEIVGVFNADMLAWDKREPPILRIVTRTNSDAGFSADLALATVVTNAVYLCGLGDELVPVINSTGMADSDHGSYWACGFPAVLVTQDFLRDSNPYYHTAKDSMRHVNWKYYLATVRALVGSVSNFAVLE